MDETLREIIQHLYTQCEYTFWDSEKGITYYTAEDLVKEIQRRIADDGWQSDILDRPGQFFSEKLHAQLTNAKNIMRELPFVVNRGLN